jgi:hypothetical protein
MVMSKSYYRFSPRTNADHSHQDRIKNSGVLA